jgi:hypothetical protein
LLLLSMNFELLSGVCFSLWSLWWGFGFFGIL